MFLALVQLALALFNRGLHRKRVFLALFIRVYRVIFSGDWVKSGFHPLFHRDMITVVSNGCFFHTIIKHRHFLAQNSYKTFYIELHKSKMTGVRNFLP